MIQDKTKGNYGKQFWGFGKRFPYDPNVPKMGDKLKVEKKPAKPKKGKNHVPGPGTYGVGSVWNLTTNGKNQDI